MSPSPGNNLYGNLDLLVLQTLEVEGPAHGLGVMDGIQRRSSGEIQGEDGALYRSLHRLEGRGLLSAAWKLTEKNSGLMKGVASILTLIVMIRRILWKLPFMTGCGAIN